MTILTFLLLSAQVFNSYSFSPIYSGMGIKSNELLGNSLRKAPVLAEVVPTTSHHLQIKSRKTILELRAGASIAIPGLDPVNIFFSQYPFAAAFMVCAVKASAADLVAQRSAVVTAVKERSPVNLRRNLAFLFYGGLYQGIFQEFLYNTFYPFLFGNGRGPATALKKVMFDLLLTAPFLCLPMAYLIKALVFKQSLKDGVKKYIHDVKNNALLIKFWKVWAPVQSMTFTIVPSHLRISFVACFSFFWLILLSSISAKSE